MKLIPILSQPVHKQHAVSSYFCHRTKNKQKNPNKKNLQAQYIFVTSGSVLQLLCCYVPLALNRNPSMELLYAPGVFGSSQAVKYNKIAVVQKLNL